MAKKITVEQVEEPKVAVASKNNFDKVMSVTKNLNKHYGKDIVKTGKNIPYITKVPFREPALDYVYTGGIAMGRFMEMLGEEHTGKTRNALRGIRQFQRFCFGCMTDNVLTAEWLVNEKTDIPYIKSCSCTNCKNPETRITVFADIEGTTDPRFMEYFDIDVDGVIYFRVDMPSQAIDIIDAYLREPSVGLIVVDSVGSLGSDSEVEKAQKDIKMNQNAMFLNRGLRKWQMALNSNSNETGKENGTSMVVINQSYQTLDLYSQDVAQGGRGLRHGKAQSGKTKIVTKNIDPKTKETKGVHIRLTNEKNKTGIPYRRMEYYLNLDPFDKEIAYCQTNVNMQYVELAILFGIVEQKGGWFYYGTEKWQGKASIVENLTQDIKDAVDLQIYN